MGKKTADYELHEKTRHGEPGFPMVVYYNDFTTYVSGMIPWHWHEEVEFVVVTQGTVEFSAGTDRFLLKAGEGIFMNADILHSMTPSGEEKAYMFSVLVSPGILGTEKGVLISSRYVTPYITDEGLRYEILRPQTGWQQEILQKLALICKAYAQKEFGYEYQLHNLICEIWFALVKESWRYKSRKTAAGGPDEERMHKALAYIQNHFREEVSLDDICGVLNISRSECCRCFRRSLRMTPFEYLMTYRIHAAAQMLLETDETVGAVALCTGFGSNSYFCKLFRRYMDCTPAEYRRGKRQGH